TGNENCDIKVITTASAENILIDSFKPSLYIEDCSDCLAKKLQESGSVIYSPASLSANFKKYIKIYSTHHALQNAMLRFSEPVKAIIDLGAFFRSFKNEAVARMILESSNEDIK